MKRKLACLPVLIVSLLVPHSICGTFATQAVQIWDVLAPKGKSGHILRMHSPDGQIRVSATIGGTTESTNVVLAVCRRDRCDKLVIPNGVGAELLWAPGSNSFALTWSDGGTVGTFHTDVYVVSDETVKKIPLSPIVLKRFGRPVKCEISESPNVVAVAWESKDILVLAVQIKPHTICDSAGTFRAYSVDVRDMSILRTYSQIDAKKEFSTQLGLPLRNADDECVRLPAKCELPQNHSIPR